MAFNFQSPAAALAVTPTPTFAPNVGMSLTPETVFVSPSQVETWELCNRKWWFKWGLGPERKLFDPPKGFQDFGTCIHSVIERFLLSDYRGCVPNDPSDKTASRQPWSKGPFKGQWPGQVTDLFPQGWDDKVDPGQSALIRKLIAAAIQQGVLVRTPGLKIETQMNREAVVHGKTTVVMTGRIDIKDLRGIQDHKSTKATRYMKSEDPNSPNYLGKAPQMLIYAMEYLQSLYEENKPFPDKIELRHNYYCKDPAKQIVRKVIAEVTPAAVLDYWTNDILGKIIPGMLAVRRIPEEKWESVPGPRDKNEACNAFGGCFAKRICAKVQTIAAYRTIHPHPPKVDGEQSKYDNQNIKGTEIMGLKDKLANKAAANQGQPAPQAAPQAPPPSTPKANPFAPVPTTASAAAAARALPKAAPPTPPTPPPYEFEPPPWAVQTCKACQGAGFDTKGNPCRICDAFQRRIRRIESRMFDIDTNEHGVFWVPKPEHLEELTALGYVMQGNNQQELVPQGDVEVQERAQVDDAELTQQGDNDAPDEEEEPEGEQQPNDLPQAAPTKRGRGRPRKDQTAVAGAGQVVQKEHFVMYLGCTARHQKAENVVYIEEVLASVGAEIARVNVPPVASYYDLDIWKRAAAVASCSKNIARGLMGKILIVRKLSKDIEPLVEALIPLAQDVWEGDGFYQPKG